MNTQFSYKNVSEKDKRFLEDYFDKKIDRISTLTKEEEFKVANMEIRIEKFAKKEAYNLEIHFYLSDKSFMSSEDDHTVVEAFDLALDKLINQLRRYRDEMKDRKK